MAQPMLRVTADKAQKPSQVTPHLLTCRIHHTGPVGSTEAFWTPKTTDDKQVAYFRGRKLYGTPVPVPAGYRGVVGERRATPREQARERNEPEEVIDVDADADEQAVQRQRADTAPLAEAATFDSFVVWGHQSTADAATDAYVRGMDEWLALAEQIHSYPEDDESKGK